MSKRTENCIQSGTKYLRNEVKMETFSRSVDVMKIDASCTESNFLTSEGCPISRYFRKKLGTSLGMCFDHNFYLIVTSFWRPEGDPGASFRRQKTSRKFVRKSLTQPGPTKYGEVRHGGGALELTPETGNGEALGTLHVVLGARWRIYTYMCIYIYIYGRLH